MIESFKTPKHHWNYFLAIEKNLENVSRYIEFNKQNFKTYSIELTHILLSASSEVDVIMKQLCLLLGKKTNNIDEYRGAIMGIIPDFADENIFINRYGLVLRPWDNWMKSPAINPDWWRGYNNVKHKRHKHFEDANLKNAINAVSALLITVVYYYKSVFENEPESGPMDFWQVTKQLKPESSLLRMQESSYDHRTYVSYST